MMVGIAAAIGIACFLGSASALVFAQKQPSTLRARLQGLEHQMASQEAPVTARDEELAKPLHVRLGKPVFDRAVAYMARFAKQANLATIDEKLAAAGRPRNLTALQFFTIRVLSLLGAVGAALAALLLMTDTSTAAYMSIAAISVAMIGPNTWLDRKVKARRAKILRHFPGALDLMVTGVEAGLTFDASMQRAADKSKGPIKIELARVVADRRLGRTLGRSLEDFGARIQLDQIRDFVSAIVTADRQGSEIGRVLRALSQDMRRDRRQRAEELGQKAPLKMLFPMVGCIFPSLFVVLLGPAVLSFVHSFLGQ